MAKLGFRTLFKDSKYAVGGGFAVLLLGLGAAFIFGEVTPYQSRYLIESSKSNINTLLNTIVLASATILALLFTVLGLASNTDVKFKNVFYHRIKQIAVFDTIVFVVTMCFFLLLNFPIPNEQELPEIWFKAIYYTTVISSTIVGAMMVTVILLLSRTILDFIDVVGNKTPDHPMIELEEDLEEAREEENHSPD